MFDTITELDYKDRSGNISVDTKAAGQSKKEFPFYIFDGKKYIFKPLSKTKPNSTIMFTFSEVFSSYIARTYFEPNSPQYRLAICKGITELQPKAYEKGVIVPSYLEEGEKTLNLMEYLRNNLSKNNPINDLVIYCFHNGCHVNSIQDDIYKYSLSCDFAEPSILNEYINYGMAIYNFFFMFNVEIFLDNKEYMNQLALQYLLSLLTRNHNFHYENFNFKTKDNRITGVVPPSDQEYSLMFIYPDQIEAHNLLVGSYKILLEELPFIKATIMKIAENSPETLEKFVEGLDQMINDLAIITIQFDNTSAFIEKMNSEAFFEHYYRYKLSNELLAEISKRKFSHRFEINVDDFFKQIIQEYIDSATQLKKIIKEVLKVSEKRLTKKL